MSTPPRFGGRDRGGGLHPWPGDVKGILPDEEAVHPSTAASLERRGIQVPRRQAIRPADDPCRNRPLLVPVVKRVLVEACSKFGADRAAKTWKAGEKEAIARLFQRAGDLDRKGCPDCGLSSTVQVQDEITSRRRCCKVAARARRLKARGWMEVLHNGLSGLIPGVLTVQMTSAGLSLASRIVLVRPLVLEAWERLRVAIEVARVPHGPTGDWDWWGAAADVVAAASRRSWPGLLKLLASRADEAATPCPSCGSWRIATVWARTVVNRGKPPCVKDRRNPDGLVPFLRPDATYLRRNPDVLPSWFPDGVVWSTEQAPACAGPLLSVAWVPRWAWEALHATAEAMGGIHVPNPAKAVLGAGPGRWREVLAEAVLRGGGVDL